MNIEFYCKHCYQKVITPDSTAGKKGRCPHCGEIDRIPTESESPQQQPGYVELDESVLQAANPSMPKRRVRIGDPGWRDSFQMSRWGEFSHEKRRRIREQQREWAQRTMAAPATGLIVGAILGMAAVFIYSALLVLAFAQLASVGALDERFDGTGVAIHIFLIAINIVLNTLIIVGANHMRMARSYSLAVAGTVFALLPIPLNLACFISFPFGCWALAMLVRPDIRESYRRI